MSRRMLSSRQPNLQSKPTQRNLSSKRQSAVCRKPDYLQSQLEDSFEEVKQRRYEIKKQCPNCHRIFALDAAERHFPICENNSSKHSLQTRKSVACSIKQRLLSNRNSQVSISDSLLKAISGPTGNRRSIALLK